MTTKTLRIQALHRNVLCVAVAWFDTPGWAAYCAPVAGIDHDDEAMAVLTNGASLTVKVATALFGNTPFGDLPYRP